MCFTDESLEGILQHLPANQRSRIVTRTHDPIDQNKNYANCERKKKSYRVKGHLKRFKIRVREFQR